MQHFRLFTDLLEEVMTRSMQDHLCVPDWMRVLDMQTGHFDCVHCIYEDVCFVKS